jgi:uncharacterized protein YbaR (Trm112 family)
MGIDRRLLDILCCPVSKVPVVMLSSRQLEYLNTRITEGGVVDVDGRAVDRVLTEGLITRDGKVVYRIDDGIPVMLPESGIGTAQFADFPA